MFNIIAPAILGEFRGLARAVTGIFGLAAVGVAASIPLRAKKAADAQPS